MAVGWQVLRPVETPVAERDAQAGGVPEVIYGPTVGAPPELPQPSWIATSGLWRRRI